MKQPLIGTKLTYLLIVGALLIGVSAAEAEDAGAAADRATVAHAYSVVSRIYEEVFNTGQLGQVDTLIAADYIDHNPIGPGGKSGREGFKQTVRALRFAFPDLRFTVDEMIVSGDKVVTRTTMQGTHKSSFMQVNPTDKQVTVAGFDIYRIANGVVAERWGTLDGFTLMQQMGVVDPMAWQHTLLGAPSRVVRKPPTNGVTKTVEKKKNVLRDDRRPVAELMDLDQLMRQFQADVGNVRVIALLSPG